MNYYFYLALLITGTGSSCEGPAKATYAADLQQALKVRFAPDNRTDRIALEQQGDLLKGYTTRLDIMDSLTTATKGSGYRVSVRLLPDEAVGEATIGIINVSVANLRSKPGHSQELATQALMGTPVQLLDLVDGWYMVRTPDRYIAWLEPGALVAMTPEEAAGWFAGAVHLYKGEGEVITTEAGKGNIVSAVVTGNVVMVDQEVNDRTYALVSLPDGTKGWLPANTLLWSPAWLSAQAFKPQALLESAYQLAGRPYLWGGTGPNGMDCSGFTKMSYYLNGFVIPRDASQQVHAGTEVKLTDDYANLLPGDQLFFGRYRDDGSEKITHTGFYLGEGRFLHAGADNGRIRENSLLPEDADYAEHRLKSLLRARRLEVGAPGVVPVGESFSNLLEGAW